jgi:hypothetical protein
LVLFFKKEQVFFFEKKEAKNFCSFVSVPDRRQPGAVTWGAVPATLHPLSGWHEFPAMAAPPP